VIADPPPAYPLFVVDGEILEGRASVRPGDSLKVVKDFKAELLDNLQENRTRLQQLNDELG